MTDDTDRKARWRLVLGDDAEQSLPDALDEAGMQMDAALDFLYGREYDGRNIRKKNERKGGSGPSTLNVPDWINSIHTLFPKDTIERLERDALERYHLEELVTNKVLLQQAQPSMTLLKAVLRSKHLMNQDVLETAREVVRRCIAQILEKLSTEIRQPFYGTLNRHQRSYIKIAKNFDAIYCPRTPSSVTGTDVKPKCCD